VFILKKSENCHLTTDISHKILPIYLFSAYFNRKITRSFMDPSFLILCPVDVDTFDNFPTSVSITLNPCDNSTTNLKIIDNKPPDGVKKEFGICGKYLNYKNRDFGIKFVEWMHALKILGCSKVHLYKKTLHPHVQDLLKYFESKDMIELDPFFEPSSWNGNYGSNWTVSVNIFRHKLTIELTDSVLFKPNYASLIQINLFNDCFYKVRNLYKYIVIFDADELLVPKNAMNWHEMMKSLEKDGDKTTDVYSFKMINYPHLSKVKAVTEVPDYYYMLRHVERTRQFSGWMFYQLKSIIVPERVQTLHQHEATLCFGGECKRKKVQPNIAQISHYREKVKHRFENYSIPDFTLYRFKEKLMKDVEATLNATRFKP
jgi:Glycosyltransferase family 92